MLCSIIPLPIESPGWGALVIERDKEENYSEEELDLCAEFAALATTAALITQNWNGMLASTSRAPRWRRCSRSAA